MTRTRRRAGGEGDKEEAEEDQGQGGAGSGDEGAAAGAAAGRGMRKRRRRAGGGGDAETEGAPAGARSGRGVRAQAQAQAQKAEKAQRVLEELDKIVCGFLASPRTGPFKEPVAWKDLGLDDYPQIVQHPMDLGTIKRKLDRREYASAAECARDIRLVWTNCMSYNQDGSIYYQLAAVCADEFERQYRAILEKKGLIDQDPYQVPSLSEKLEFSYDIFKLSSEKLGTLIELIEEQNGFAIYRESDANGNEIQINVDALSPKAFHEASVFVKEALGIPTDSSAPAAASTASSASAAAATAAAAASGSGGELEPSGGRSGRRSGRRA